MNIEPNKPPSQIDYILVSSRWSAAIQNCKTMWGLPIKSYGRRYDDAAVKATFRVRLKCSRSRRRKDFTAFKSANKVTLHNNNLQQELDKSERPSTAIEQWQILKTWLTSVNQHFPRRNHQKQRK